MSNPYQAPAATVRDFADTGADQPYEPSVFSIEGRIGRLRYIVYSFVVQMIVIVLAGIAAALLIPAMGGRDAAPGVIWPLMVLIYVPIFAALLVMARRRLHDLNLSGWMVLLMLVPLVNAILGLVLMFWPGTRGGNRFGPPPAGNGFLVLFFGLILPLVLAGVLAAVAIPAYQQYTARAHAAATMPQGLDARP